MWIVGPKKFKDGNEFMDAFQNDTKFVLVGVKRGLFSKEPVAVFRGIGRFNSDGYLLDTLKLNVAQATKLVEAANDGMSPIELAPAIAAQKALAVFEKLRL